MKRLIVAAVLAVAMVSCRPAQQSEESVRIAIASIVEIEPIAQLRQGFREELLASEWARTRTVTFQEENAQGDQGLANQVADRIVASRPALVYVLGTPLAQAIQNRAPDLLLVQGAVTDPVAAGLADSWEASGRSYIATSDLPPVEQQLDLIAELSPDARRVGILYNPGEANSAAVVRRLRDAVAQRSGYQLVERPVATSADVASAVAGLLGRADVLYLPPDNTVYSAIPVVGQFAREHRIPWYASTESAFDEGAVAVLSLDYVQLGRESARLTLAVLSGATPDTIPIQVNRNPKVTVSRSVASELGLNPEVLVGRSGVTVR